MKIQLPLENWADLLPFVPRHQLVEIVKQLNDRQFAKILQFFLTEVGQIALGHLRIVGPRFGPWQNDPSGYGGPIVEVRKEMLPLQRPDTWDVWPPSPSDLETNLPEGPIPANVKGFKLIELSYFNESVANFLRQFQQQEQQQHGNSLLDNANLCFSALLSTRDDHPFIPILAQLIPMIGNINSINIYRLRHMGFGCVGLEPNNAATQLLTTMLTKARILELRGNSCDMHRRMSSWCNWLNAPRDDGKPRALRLSGSFPNIKNLIERIKKDFSKAIRPISFFVHVRALEFGLENAYWHWQDICLDNGQTNERLVVKTIDPHPRDLELFAHRKLVLISRYPARANKDWIEANEQEIMGWKCHEQNRRIRFELSLRNGANV